MDTIVNKLREHLKEEEHDVEMYTHLMHEAREHGMHNLADALCLILKDEKSHRNYLKMYLDEWDEKHP